MIKFYMRTQKQSIEELGLIPMFFWDADPRSAAEQLNDRYAHGGGFSPFGQGKFTLTEWTTGPARLKFPGDRPFKELARGHLHMSQPTEELILVFDSAIVVIVQKSGEFLVTRCD